MGIDRTKLSADYRVLAHDHDMIELESQRINDTRDDSENDVLQHRDSAAEVCIGPSCFDLCDDVLLFSLFRNSHVLREKGYGYGKPEQLEVKILVSFVWIVHGVVSSYLICLVAFVDLPRKSTFVPRDNCGFLDECETKAETKKLKDSVFVGEVIRSPEECALDQGSVVTSLRRGPVKAKYLKLPADALISIPLGVDTGEATALMATFVPAMGLLFHGILDRRDRFSRSALKGCDILVTGGGSDEASAVVSLALLAGANRIFVLQAKTSMATSHAESVRVELVSDDPAQWYPVVDRYMDLIVDLDFPKNFGALYGVLKSTGRMVCKKPDNNGLLAPFNEFCHELNLVRYPNTSIYDIDHQIENDYPEMVVRSAIRDVQNLMYPRRNLTFGFLLRLAHKEGSTTFV